MLQWIMVNGIIDKKKTLFILKFILSVIKVISKQENGNHRSF